MFQLVLQILLKLAVQNIQLGRFIHIQLVLKQQIFYLAVEVAFRIRVLFLQFLQFFIQNPILIFDRILDWNGFLQNQLVLLVLHFQQRQGVAQLPNSLLRVFQLTH